MKPQRLLVGFIAVALLFGFVAPTVAAAQPIPEPNTRRDELANAIEDASAAEVMAVKELERVTARRRVLQAQVATLERKAFDAQRQVEAAEAELARITVQIEAVQRDMEGIRAEIEASKTLFNDAALKLYKGPGNRSDGVFTLLSTRGGAHDVVAGSKYLSENSSQLQRELQRQASLKAQLDATQTRLRTEQVKEQDARKTASAERDRAAELLSHSELERQQVAATEAQERQMIEGLRARRAEFEAEYNALQARIDNHLSRGSPVPGNGRFDWPVQGAVRSGFGPRVHPIFGGSRMHTGVDISAPSGTPIKAAGDGVVVMAGSNGGYGNWTLIDHGDGLATGYAHQSSIGVAMGQRVRRGEVIGRVGSTGASTGPHLHWEVRVNGAPVDPMGWV
jgi:murein DD-endopeptidase MepM/ murein hydrolase activator NlpD